ncbi:EmrB/QacA subfamily drug resistance transporter [Nocardia tenerifensis]|uniref:EmrB/QacA subfamily drug resistance transporter n=1 Tax=Nocardia tenerifensis TaxID=228006 RepID=A0A318KZ54_9NOCA|nr:MFS transporter [Nocardia tenerifensis]PXX71134.1 EmrB/QacA subfamily drug resistance transporter [Nocardia tenerifensis]
MTVEIPTRRRVAGFAGLAVASFLGCIDLTIVTTALPAIGEDLRAGPSNTELTLGVFLMALSMFMVTAGRVADRLGRRKVLLAGLALFVVASAGAAASWTIGALLVARFVQGAACAVLYTSTSTLVESLFPQGDRGKAIGWLYSVNGLGLAIGPVLGGLLVPSLGWQSIFWINIPLGLAALLAIGFAVPSVAPDTSGGTDWAGQIVVAFAVVSAVGIFVGGDLRGWLSPWVLIAAVVLVAAVAVGIVAERRAANPLIDPALFGNRRFVAAIVSDFSLGLFYAAALLVIPTYLTQGRDLDVRAAGFVLLLVSGTLALSSPVAGRFIDRFGPQSLLPFGFGSLALAGAGISLAAFGDRLPILLVALVLFGGGWALVLGPATVLAISTVPPTRSGFAVGASWTFHNLGGAIGAALATVVFGHVDLDLPREVGDATGRVTAILAVTSLIAAVTVVALTARRPAPDAVPAPPVPAKAGT